MWDWPKAGWSRPGRPSASLLKQEHVLGSCRRGCPPQGEGGKAQPDLTQAAMPPGAFWKQLEPRHFPPPRSLTAPTHLVTKSVSARLSPQPSWCSAGHVAATLLGRLGQKPAGSGSLGPKPGLLMNFSDLQTKQGRLLPRQTTGPRGQGEGRE